MENQVLECLETRRSVRKYKKEQIAEEQLQAILKAGTYAPTGMGAQSPVMVVVQDPELIRKLSAWNAEIMGTDSDPFYGAPTVIVVLADSTRNTYIEDGSLVMGNLRETFAREEGKALLKEWGLGENYVGIGNCVLGYRDCEYPQAKPRKDTYIKRIG